jgi:hypothetical protein
MTSPTVMRPKGSDVAYPKGHITSLSDGTAFSAKSKFALRCMHSGPYTKNGKPMDCTANSILDFVTGDLVSIDRDLLVKFETVAWITHTNLTTVTDVWEESIEQYFMVTYKKGTKLMSDYRMQLKFTAPCITEITNPATGVQQQKAFQRGS